MATVRTAKRLVLGREVAHMMEAAGKTQAEVAKILGTSQSRIAGVLAGQNAVSLGDLERLANRLGFTDPEYQEALFALRRDNHKRGFWSTGYRRAYSDELRLRVDVEQHADRIRQFEVEVVPGLAQIEGYVRSIYEDAPEIDGLTVEDRVLARIDRQSIFDKEDPPEVHFVLSESCVRRVWCPPSVMVEQLEWLVSLSQRPTVMIQILPFDQPVGRRTAIGERFTLLRIPSPGAAGPLELAYTEGHGELRYLDGKEALRAYDTAWTRLTAAALGFEETRTFLRHMITEFG